MDNIIVVPEWFGIVFVIVSWILFDGVLYFNYLYCKKSKKCRNWLCKKYCKGCNNVSK